MAWCGRVAGAGRQGERSPAGLLGVKKRQGDGGERGIRTLEAVLAPTRFPIVLLQPLGHLSATTGAPVPRGGGATLTTTLGRGATTHRVETRRQGRTGPLP